jgi:hypothetical protein
MILFYIFLLYKADYFLYAPFSTLVNFFDLIFLFFLFLFKRFLILMNYINRISLINKILNLIIKIFISLYCKIKKKMFILVQ